jgi:hypothetical protein
MQKVRESLGLPLVEIPNITPFTVRTAYSEPLAPQITKHLNIWMESLRGCITIDPSQTSTQKINDMMNDIHEEGLIKLSAHVLAHFLYDRGIDIAPADAARVARGVTKKMIQMIQGIAVDDFFAKAPVVTL